MNKSNWDSYWREEKELEYWRKPAKSILKLMNRFDPDIQSKVLDLGCGIGRHAIVFAQKGFDVVALDNSQEGLNELKEEVKRNKLSINTVTGNYLDLIFEKESFDIIISYNVIYHGYRENIKKAVRLCKDYLKPKGTLFFTCPSRDDGKFGSGEKVAPNTYRSLNSVHPGDIHYFSDEKDIKEFISGLKLISLKKNEHYWDNNGEKQFSSYWEVIAEKGHQLTATDLVPEHIKIIEKNR